MIHIHWLLFVMMIIGTVSLGIYIGYRLTNWAILSHLNEILKDEKDN